MLGCIVATGAAVKKLVLCSISRFLKTSRRQAYNIRLVIKLNSLVTRIYYYLTSNQNETLAFQSGNIFLELIIFAHHTVWLSWKILW